MADINVQQEWIDIFGGGNKPDDVQQNNFGRAVETNQSIFNREKEEEIPASTQIVDEPKLDEQGNPIEESRNTDEGIFIHDEDLKKLGRRPKYNFTDASGYFEDRIKSGVFVPIEEEVGGEKKTFIPKTPEEFDEFINLQLTHRFTEKETELQKNWYESKSDAWKTIAQYAELTDNIEDVIPFLQGVKNIQDISAIDPTTEEGAEQIVRYKMVISGEPEDVIEDQIDALKKTDKLKNTAEKYKPIIVQNEQERLASVQQQKIQEQIRNEIIINNYRNKAIEEIEKPLFGTKLRREDQAAIYELIAEPDDRQGGYAIYSEIDRLYEKNDFDTLKQIALLLKNKEGYLQYRDKSTKDGVAQDLTRKLKVVVPTGTGANDNLPTPSKPYQQPVQRANDISAFGRYKV